jgi:hypothetical protein
MTAFLGENRLAQVLESIKEYVDTATESGFKTLTVSSSAALNTLTTGTGGQDGNTIYLVGTTAPYQMYVWNGSAYVLVGDGGGTVDSELSFDTVNTILDANGFPEVSA